MTRYPTFTMAGARYAIVPADDLAELGGARLTARQRQRKAVASMLRAAREHAGLTQAELAERIERAQPTVAKAEKGTMQVGDRYARAVLKACGLPEDWTGA